MHISTINIYNYRKLKNCRLDLSEKQTILVGANNSGKTSAMNVLAKFLVKDKQKSLSALDFTVSNWNEIEAMSEDWRDSEKLPETIDSWRQLCPAIDVRLHISDGEEHLVTHLIPTLDWKGSEVGFRLNLEPNDLDNLRESYLSARQAARETEEAADHNKPVNLWPRSAREYIEKNLSSHFKISAFLIDPHTGAIGPELDNTHLDSLIRIDLIEAHRKLPSNEGLGPREGLASEMKGYYEKHINPEMHPDMEDLGAIHAISSARNAFDEKLNSDRGFKPHFDEIKEIGYPGFTDPTIHLSSQVSPADSIDHDMALQFEVSCEMANGGTPPYLPESANGLGYNNLIHVTFRLIKFRDAWVRSGKAQYSTARNKQIPPLHLVLIEEPEAYLHAQVQQLFISNAYKVLRNSPNLNGNSLNTQLVVSTHSSHVAHEVDFADLRYLHRGKVDSKNSIPLTNIVDLSRTFGDNEDSTAKFVARYIKTTHCDLFFANGIILVEGAAERMLIPHMIRGHFPELSKSYISILEIGGAHAHRLSTLIERLGLPTLVISDLDSVDAGGKKAPPKKGEKQKTSNSTLTNWLPKETLLDELLVANSTSKTKDNVRVTYQTEIAVEISGETLCLIPRTFEDAIAYANTDLFQKLKLPTGLLGKLSAAIKMDDPKEVIVEVHKALLKGDKANMAVDLLFHEAPEELKTPEYIAEGLDWLTAQLSDNEMTTIQDGSDE